MAKKVWQKWGVTIVRGGKVKRYVFELSANSDEDSVRRVVKRHRISGRIISIKKLRK